MIPPESRGAPQGPPDPPPPTPDVPAADVPAADARDVPGAEDALNAYALPGAPAWNRAAQPPAQALSRGGAARVLSAFGLVLLVSLALDASAALAVAEEAPAWLGVLGAALLPAVGESPSLLRALMVSKWLGAGLALAAAYVLVRRLPTPWASFGLRGLPIGRALGWGCAGLAGLYGALLLSAIAIVGLQLAFGSEWLMDDVGQRVDLLSALVSETGWRASLLLVAVALHEELLFRGLLLPALRPFLGWTGALVLSSLIFGVLHAEQGLVGIAQATGLGLVLGALFLRSGSLWPAILAHFAFDRIQFELVRLLLPFMEQMRDLAG